MSSTITPSGTPGLKSPVAIVSRNLPQQAPAEPIKCLQELAGYIQNGWLIVWQHHAVFAVEVIRSQFDPPAGMESDQLRHLQMARAFNSDREWFIWPAEDGFDGRKCEDGSGTDAFETVDSQAKLRGVIVRQLGDRNPKETWVVKTRNYVGYNQFDHCGFTDSRFMDIIKIGKESKS